MTLSITDIEDALLSTLTASETLGGSCRTIETYAGQFDAEVIDKTVIRFPACFVLFAQSAAEPETNRQMLMTMEFSFLLAAQNLRGNPQARRQPAGAYALLQDLYAILNGQMLGLDLVEPFLLMSETALLNTLTLAVYEARYRVQIYRPIKE
jgi:phage gp37-like protein